MLLPINGRWLLPINGRWLLPIHGEVARSAGGAASGGAAPEGPGAWRPALAERSRTGCYPLFRL